MLIADGYAKERRAISLEAREQAANLTDEYWNCLECADEKELESLIILESEAHVLSRSAEAMGNILAHLQKRAAARAGRVQWRSARCAKNGVQHGRLGNLKSYETLMPITAGEHCCFNYR